MAIAGYILWYFGLAVELVGGIWFVVEAFRLGKVWGACSLFLFLLVVGSAVWGNNGPAGAGLISIALLVVLVFLFKHWSKASLPAMIVLLGGIVSLMGLLLCLEAGASMR